MPAILAAQQPPFGQYNIALLKHIEVINVQ